MAGRGRVGRTAAAAALVATAAAGVFAVAGCAGWSESPRARRLHAEARAAGFEPADLAGSVDPAGVAVQLVAYRRSRGEAEVLAVYLEGDGVAWATRSRPSADPTPRDALGWRLARADPAPQVAYLARPCQFLPPERLAHCDPRLWTSARFAPEVVAATSRAIDRLRERAGSRRVRLVGFSGGGVLAALVAAGRADVAELVTVAAPLDPGRWTAHHGVSPLRQSLDPLEAAERLAAIPQRHFSGSRDRVVPTRLQDEFVRRVRARGGEVRRIEMAGFDHDCCWAERWSELLGDLPEALR